MADRRSFLRSSLALGAGALAGPLLAPARLLAAPQRLHGTRVIDLVDATTVIDMLGLLTLDWRRMHAWSQDPGALLGQELAKLRASGIRVFHPAVDPNAQDPYRGALAWMQRYRDVLATQKEHLRPILGISDLDALQRDGKLGVVMGLQSSEHFRTTADVATFHALGQRVSQLTYNERSLLGSGCRDPRDRGLTPHGGAIVAEMNRVGMAVDLSHCSEKSTRDAIAASSVPVLVTHANCQAVARHPRNKSDAVLRELARRGGVIGITAVRAFVRPGSPATIDDLLDHYEHAIRVAGIEHVGLGSDCDVDPRDASGRVSDAYAIRGLEHPRRTYDIAAGLLARGYSERDVALVIGGNFRRVLGEIWGAAPQDPDPACA